METERILTDLAVMFVGAKAAGYVFERLRQPAVIGELLVGMILGHHMLGAISDSHVLEVFQELGAVILLFAVGLDTPLSELRAVGGRSLAVGALGIIVPFAGGAILVYSLGNPSSEALFVGTAMVATSVGVTARVLSDLGRVREPESRVILGAAVVDDILGLLVLAVVAGSVTGSLSVGSVVVLALLAIGFVILIGGLGSKLVQRATPLLDRMGESGIFAVAMGLCLVLASLAAALKLAAIIGAFLAGMALAETRDRYHLENRIAPVYSLLVPFFFVVTGSLVDLSVFLDLGTAGLTAAILVVAILGKLIGCGGAALGMGKRSAAIVGVGMVPRGEVGILVATIGLTRGVVGPDLYAVVVAMSVLTTLVAPPFLAALFKGRPGASPPAGRDVRTEEIEGLDG